MYNKIMYLIFKTKNSEYKQMFTLSPILVFLFKRNQHVSESPLQNPVAHHANDIVFDLDGCNVPPLVSGHAATTTAATTAKERLSFPKYLGVAIGTITAMERLGRGHEGHDDLCIAGAVGEERILPHLDHPPLVRHQCHDEPLGTECTNHVAD